MNECDGACVDGDSYTIKKIALEQHSDFSELNQSAAFDLGWSTPFWQHVPAIYIDKFLPESSAHHPKTQCKLQYSNRGIFGIFKVKDRYVKCVAKNFQDMVCKDSCVEIFLQPHPTLLPAGQPHASYFSFEFSGNGTLLSYYISDSERAPNGFKKFKKLTAEEAEKIQMQTTLPAIVQPEIQQPMDWYLSFFLPFEIFENYVGALRHPESGVSGQYWRANVFKCADDSSHPHWASWQPCSEFNFHAPADFGWILFK